MFCSSTAKHDEVHDPLLRNLRGLVMPRAPRKQSEADIYHVFSRGVGRQFIFEEDADNVFFLNALGKLLSEYKGRLLAWALMGNHFHLLLQMPLQDLSKLMKRLQGSYAQYFNRRYDRVGCLFQGRFGSQPIESDEQLMACVRYIHRNPMESHLCETCDYQWNSYRGYLVGAAVTDTEFVLSVFGGIDQFVEFHKSWDDDGFSFLDIGGQSSDAKACRMTDHQADEVARSLLGKDWRERIADLGKCERNEWLRTLKRAGLSVRQIERMTGIGRGIIAGV